MVTDFVKWGEWQIHLKHHLDNSAGFFRDIYNT